MEEKEFIDPVDYALRHCVGHDDLRLQLHQPFIQLGGVAATDGRVLLYVNRRAVSDRVWDSYKTQKSPNIGNVFFEASKDRYMGDLSIDQMMMTPIEERYDLVEIGGIYLMHERYNKLVEISQMLGACWQVYKGQSCVMFKAENIRLLIMGVLRDEKDTRNIAHIVLHKLDMVFNMDWNAGKAYCEYHKRMQKEKAEILKAQRHGNLWEVRVAKYSTFWVEAADAKEAEEFAKAHCDEVDDDAFDDSEIEYEGVQGEADLDDVPDGGDYIYTAEGWMDKDEYIDTMEEEE